MLSLNLIANDLREKNKARYFYDRAIKMLLLILIMLVLGGCVLYLIKGNYKYSLNMMSGQQDLLSEHDINNKLKEYHDLIEYTFEKGRTKCPYDFKCAKCPKGETCI